MFRLAIISIFAVACAADTGKNDVDGWCRAHRCEYADLAFDPEPELLTATESVLSGLNAVSGLGLAIDHGYGIPIRRVPETHAADGTLNCGSTIVTREVGGDILSIEIEISMNPPKGCMVEWMTIRHEIACHAINPLAWGDVDQEGHTATGMCSSVGDASTIIDKPSLDAMCSGFGICKQIR